MALKVLTRSAVRHAQRSCVCEARAMDFPALADLVGVSAAGGTAIGAAIGLMLKGGDGRRLAENILLGSGLGAVAGTILALAAYIGAKAAGA